MAEPTKGDAGAPELAKPPVAEPVAPPPAKLPVRRTLVLAILFVVIIPLQFLIENSDVMLDNIPLSNHVRESIEHLGSLFHSRFALIPRPLEARYVAMVSISEASEGPLRGPCEVRSFLLKLLPPLVDTRPALIVSDIALTGEDASDTCPPDAQESRALSAAIIEAAKTTPLIIGQASVGLEDVPEARAAHLREQGFGPNDLLLRNPIHLDPQPPNVAFGLIRMNRQFEKVPVAWFAHARENAGAEPRPTLALAAAEMYRATFPDGVKRLQALEDSRYHPVTSLLSESAFTIVPAINVICGSAVANHDWQDCSPPTGDVEIRSQLHGRVVVLGFSDRPNDLWNTPIGRVAGYVLHSNYIEALLDARAYRPLDFGLQCLLSLLWFALVELPFWIPGLSIFRALIFSAVISIIVLFLVSYVALVNFGLYISLFAPSVLIILAPVLHIAVHALGHKKKEG